jgi:predicted transcriptional regulator
MVIQLSPKRRNELEVMRDVLDVCMKSANKTRIVYSANLNFTRLNRYLHTLLSLGFLAKETAADGSVYYKTTPAGADFVEGCANIEKTRKKDKSKRVVRAKLE